MNKISVIIPSYNRASLISATIDNMLGQSVKPHEIIVVDDGSNDNTQQVLNRYGTKIITHFQSNQGPGAARNVGLSLATGDLIQFMDSDDLASNSKLEIQSNAIEKSGADFAYGPWVRCKIEDSKIEFLDDILQSCPIPANKSMLEWMLSGWSLVFQNCLFRRSVLDKAGLYRTDLMPSEDSEYFTRILLTGATYVHTAESLVFYREHQVNKITASGTTSVHRAIDWTKYLNITGSLVDQHLHNMHFSTLVSLAAHVRNHNKYCQIMGLAGLDKSHPYSNLRIPGGNMYIYTYNLYQRILRKIHKSPDFNNAFCRGSVTPEHYRLAEEIGLYRSHNAVH